MKFLFDLFPIILFFAAFKVWGIFTATAVAIAATLAQVAWVAFRHRKVDTMLWVSLGVIVVFGGATLVLHDEKFIQWKPTVLYWLFAIGLLAARYAFGNNLIEKMMGKQLTLPHPVWDKLNVRMGAVLRGARPREPVRGAQLHRIAMGELQAVRHDRRDGRVHHPAEPVAHEISEGRVR